MGNLEGQFRLPLLGSTSANPARRSASKITNTTLATSLPPSCFPVPVFSGNTSAGRKPSWPCAIPAGGFPPLGMLGTLHALEAKVVSNGPT